MPGERGAPADERGVHGTIPPSRKASDSRRLRRTGRAAQAVARTPDDPANGFALVDAAVGAVALLAALLIGLPH